MFILASFLKIYKLKGVIKMKKCSQCNQNFSDDVAFCPKCGRKLDEIVEEKRFCSKCGQQIDINTKFCPKCGAANEVATKQNGLDSAMKIINNEILKNKNDIEKNDVVQMIREKYLSFSGRLNRKAYIIRGLIAYVIMMILLAIVDVLFEDEISFDEFGMLTTSPGTAELFFTFVICAIGIVIMVSLGVRRLHDLNRTGWMILLNCVPIANIALSVYMVFFKGTEGGNEYGPDPLQMK